MLTTLYNSISVITVCFSMYTLQLNSTTFPISTWCAFRRSFRTNNDVEGWHNKINQNTPAGGLNMYLLIERLHKEAKDVVLTCHFLEDGVVLHYQRTKYAQLHGKIFSLWEKFSEGTINGQQLLLSCSHLNGPATDRLDNPPADPPGQ